ncbi:MAG: P-loop containing nucleoside triphosphate hydrolase [Parcubacteria group bacterium]|nr:P-loop containing nucleoside triphosphate hydrolase [Parcubacteria group bacterium]
MSKIILVGGPPRSGKTTLARKISKEENIPWISTDAFDDIAKEYVSKVELDDLFPKTELRRKSGGGNDEMYAAFSTEEITDAYLKQAETIHSAVESFILCANTEGWDYVIEGYHITPKLIAKLQAEYKNISSVILVNTAGEEAIERSKQSDTKQDWLRDRTKNEKTFQKVAEMIGLFSQKLIEEAGGVDVKVIDMSGDFQVKFDEAFDYLRQ